MSDKEKVGELATLLDKAILGKTQDALQGQWDLLSEEDKEKVTRAATELAKEEAKARLGLGADTERITVLKATIGNWEMVGQIKAKSVERAFWEGVKEAAAIGFNAAAGFLGTLAASALKNLVPYG